MDLSEASGFLSIYASSSEWSKWAEHWRQRASEKKVFRDLYKEEGYLDDGKLRIIPKHKPGMRYLESTTFNVGYGCLFGFLIGTGHSLGLAKRQLSQENMSKNRLSWAMRSTGRIMWESGWAWLRPVGGLVFIYSLYEGAFKYMYIHMADRDAPPPAVMTVDAPDGSKVEVPELPKEQAMRVTNKRWYKSWMRYPLNPLDKEDPRICALAAAPFAALTFKGLTEGVRSAGRWGVPFTAGVYLWNTRGAPQGYLDTSEQYIPDEYIQQ